MPTVLSLHRLVIPRLINKHYPSTNQRYHRRYHPQSPSAVVMQPLQVQVQEYRQHLASKFNQGFAVMEHQRSRGYQNAAHQSPLRPVTPYLLLQDYHKHGSQLRLAKWLPATLLYSSLDCVTKPSGLADYCELARRQLARTTTVNIFTTMVNDLNIHIFL